MKRKALALLLSAAAVVSLAACGGGRSARNSQESNSVYEPVPVVIPAKTVRVGLVCPGSDGDLDASDPFLLGRGDANAALSGRNIQVTWVVKGAEEETCEEVNRALAEDGCQLVFNASPEFEEAMRAVAADYPSVQFAALGGTQSWDDELDNTHNAWAAVHEGWYLAGIAAGLKLDELVHPVPAAPETEPATAEEESGIIEETEGAEEPEEPEEPEEEEEREPLLGFIGAGEDAGTVSAYTAWLLGARSVYPEAELIVRYTGSALDAAEEREAAKELAEEGCLVLAQNTGAITPALVSQALGLCLVGYGTDYRADAPDAFLLSVNIDWSHYYEYAIDSVALGVPFEQDWCQGLRQGAVALDTNRALLPAGAEEKMRDAQSAMRGGFEVFDVTAFTVDGEELETAPVDFAFSVPEEEDAEPEPLDAVFDGAFHESYFRSVPYFDYGVDGVTYLRNGRRR